jgi:hypothetical protein
VPEPIEQTELKSPWWLAFRVIDEPGAVFRQLAAKPVFIVPLILLVVTTAIVAAGMPTAMLREGAERQADIMERRAPDTFTEADRIEMLENASSPKARMLWIFGLGSVGAIVVLLVIAAVFRLIFGAVGSEPLTFRDELAITTHAWMPQLFGGVLMVLLWRYAGFEQTLSLGFLVPGEGFLHNLAAGITLFGVWTVYLLALGNQVRTRMKGIGTALTIVGGLYILVKLVSAGFTTLAMGLGG